MHIHSRYCDGMQWPEEIVNRAKNFGLELIALTDHDTVAGNLEFIKACKQKKIQGIAGVEIDCVAEFNVHTEMNTPKIYQSEILGYFPNQSYKNTEKLLNDVLTHRKEKIKFYILRASEVFNNPDLTWDDFKNFHSDPSRKNLNFTYMKPHLFRYLIKRKVPQIQNMNYGSFKETYFDAESQDNLELGMRSLKSNKLTLKDVVATIRQDKGFAVIPHLALRFIPNDARKDPLRIYDELEQNKPTYKAFLEYCQKLKVWGIEMYYYQDWAHQPDMIDYLNAYIKQLAKKRFCYTWGSDCHGAGSQTDTLGKFSGDFNGFI
ncbi:MAG: PHP domain-containing protein [Promethearchaeota archaeon]